MKNISVESPLVITPEALFEHWLGHRRLTRRVIEAFPDDKLFTYSVGGMRPFSELALEMISMAAPGVVGLATGKWESLEDLTDPAKNPPKTKKQLLEMWDNVTAQLREYWPQIPPHRFQEVDKAFGQYEGPVHWILFYFIDNEIHHRGQGYVYLRSLGIEPPYFWERQ